MESKASLGRLFTAVLVYAVGLFLMIGSDAQKYWTLQNRKGLISDGFFMRTRNPNYLGEVMIYLSFGLLSDTWFSYCFLAFMWLAVFWPRMAGKDAQLSKKAEFAEYKERSYLFLPKVFSEDVQNAVLYAALAVFGAVTFHLLDRL